MSESESNVIKAAKVVVALSGWGRRPEGREVYQTSYMAIEVLRAAIQEAENPTLTLQSEPVGIGETIRAMAPEPMPAGIGGSAR